MSEEIVYPRRGKTDPDAGPVAVMVAMEQDLALIRRVMGIKGRSTCSLLSSKLFRVIYEYQEISLIGPVLGAPHAVMILEKLNVLGAEKIVFFGWCGSLQRGVRVGDFVIPDRGVVGEGTSPYYPIHEKYPTPAPVIARALEESLVEHSTPFHKGPVWSTDAPYRETKDRVLSLQGDGVLVVDMEVSALLTVGRFRDIDVGALLLVSDELGTLRWRHGFSTARFKESRQIAAEVLCAACVTLSSRTDGHGQG